MNNTNTFLPTLLPGELYKLMNQVMEDSDASHLHTVVKHAYDFMYDDAYNYNTIVARKDSQLPEVIKSLSIKAQAISEDGNKVKASATTLSTLLTQTTFGKTGVMLRLPHSGFTVKLKIITAVMRSDLQYNLANSIIGLDRRFTGDIYTAIYVMLTETIMRFFLDLVDYSTFNYRKKEDLLKFIKTKDINIIMLTIAKLIYPDGYEDFAYICGNDITNDAGETRVCAETTEAGHAIDLGELIYFTHELSEAELSQLNKTEKNCLTESDVTKYQDNLAMNATTEATILGLTFTIDAGNVKTYIEKSKDWLQISILNSDAYNKEDIDLIAELIEITALGKYYYAITKIENDSYTGNDITVEHMNIMSTNPELASSLIGIIKGNINSTVYVIGVPKYTCPNCLERKAIVLDDAGNPIPHKEEIISNVNVIDLFTYLV